MLRSLVDEVVRRRLWPIPLVALLIAIAAPLLFMKSAPEGAPAATEAPPVAAPGKLPVRAEKLLNASDKAAAPRKRSTRAGQDPFAPPASARQAAEAPATATAPAPATASASKSGGSSSTTAIPVVITNSDGSKATVSVPTKPTATKPTKPRKRSTSKRRTKPKSKPSTPATPATVTYVDVRFAKRMGSMVRYRVPRLQTFRAGGRVAAMFVKYSPARDKAVFAIAPSTKVVGKLRCRTKKGVCRYVDIPAGSSVRLRMRTESGSVVSRRLEVVRIRRLPVAVAAASPSGTKASARSTPLAEAKCLLNSLLKLPVIVPSISADFCD